MSAYVRWLVCGTVAVASPGEAARKIVPTILVILAGSIAIGQTAPGESPEHQHARLDYEAALNQMTDLKKSGDTLEALAMCVAGTSDSNRKCTMDKEIAVPAAMLQCPDHVRHNKKTGSAIELGNRGIGLYKQGTAIPLESLRSRMDHVDECSTLYPSTIDKKVGELTTRETDQIKACKSLDLYPQQK